MKQNEVKMKIEFTIDHIDPLGQGVFKNEKDVYFIKKTLPGETGIAELTKSKKGVHFAQLLTLDKKSEKRVESKCSHYSECNGCAFLHTSYTEESNFKMTTARRALSYFQCDQITFHQAKERFYYRNRIQLHYNKRFKKIGFINSNGQIIPIKTCLVLRKDLQKKLDEFLAFDQWLQEGKMAPNEGHVELYAKDNGVEVQWNKPYAHGGFTQVNQQMNSEMCTFITQYVKEKIAPNKIIFDLFGGNGNLSRKMTQTTLVVDSYPKTPPPIFHQTYFNADLYSAKTIDQIKKFFPKKPDLIIFDPPRSGVKNLGEFLSAFNPEEFIFIACEFSSFTRDIKSAMHDYQLSEVHLFDLFPGTHHFETIGLFTKRK